MPKAIEAHYRLELDNQRTAWQRKSALRTAYRSWYARISDELTAGGPTIEIGSGCGNFKEYRPATIATDVIDLDGSLDCVADARSLPFGDQSVANVVMIDVLHHLPRPLDFLREALRCVKPGGRIVILEPSATPWSRFVLGHFHHEPLDLDQDIFAEDGTPEPPNDDFMFANQAFASLLFVRNAAETSARLPGSRISSVQRSDFLVYPATGGFSYFCLVPGFLAGRLLALESRLVRRTASFTAMRLLVVIERDQEVEPP